MWTATDSVDLQTLFGKSSLENNIAWLIIAIWKGSIEFSPLTRVYFESRIKSHRLGKYNSWNSGSWGCSDLGSNPEDRCDLPEALNRKEGHGSLSLKAGMHCNVSHFPLLWLSPLNAGTLFHCLPACPLCCTSSSKEEGSRAAQSTVTNLSHVHIPHHVPSNKQTRNLRSLEAASPLSWWPSVSL